MVFIIGYLFEAYVGVSTFMSIKILAVSMKMYVL